MKAIDLKDRFKMSAHEENGMYLERHYEHHGEGRAESGSTMFYVGPDEYTEFHRIDCDEYWCFNAGAVLEIWTIDTDGKLSIKNFGIDDDADPLAYFPAGAIFASRHKGDNSDGTFFTCITVPRFDYRGFELVSKDTVLGICADAENFFL